MQDFDEAEFGLGTQLAAEMLTGLVNEVPSTSMLLPILKPLLKVAMWGTTC